MPCIYSVIDHRWQQNIVRTNKGHTRWYPSASLMFLPCLTSSVIYYWTEAWQHGIYLFYIIKRQTSTGILFQNLSSLLESWPLPTLVNMKNAIWHYLLSIKNEAISVVAMHSHCQTWQNGMPKVARKAFNIREVWNPVCCHGNKTVEFELWSTSSRILLQRIKHFWYKLAEISLSYLIKIWLSVWHHQLANLYILKIEYLWNEKRYLKIVNCFFLLMQNTFLCFKMA